MLNELAIIKETEVLGKQFRVYGTHDNPLFMAKDVAGWIEHSNPSQMIKDAELAENEVVKRTLGTLSNAYSALFLTEYGLYEVLMQSRKPIAKEFKKKVKEVLKDMRIHGMSLTPEKMYAIMSTPDSIIMMVTKYRDEKELRVRAQSQLEEQKPKVEFAEAVAISDTVVDMRAFSKLVYDKTSISMGSKRMFKWLRDEGYLRFNNEPYQRYVDAGWFKTVEQPYVTKSGVTKLSIKTVVTGKGQTEIFKRLREQFVA